MYHMLIEMRNMLLYFTVKTQKSVLQGPNIYQLPVLCIAFAIQHFQRRFIGLKIEDSHRPPNF